MSGTDKWTRVCSSLDNTDQSLATVSCKQLNYGFENAKAIKIDQFKIPIGQEQYYEDTNHSVMIKCTGDELAVNACKWEHFQEECSNGFVDVLCDWYGKPKLLMKLNHSLWLNNWL